MKIWKNKFLKQMIIVITLIFVIFNGIAPSKVYATKSQEGILRNFLESSVGNVASAIGFSTNVSGEVDWGIDNIFGNLVKDLIYLVIALGDVGISAMQVTLLGDLSFWTSTLVGNKNDNLANEESWIYADDTDVDALQNGGTSDRGSMLVIASDQGLKRGLFGIGGWKVPNILYSPENIFSNKIAALDANYINPHEYTAVNDSAESREEAISFAEKIRPTIASWYRAFRNIAIVALLSVLVYIGIRILIGTVSEKAKYKERLTDWFIALCLVFFMHFIMAGIMMIAEKITNLFSETINSGIIVAVDDGTIFRTSFMGYIRFAAQSDSWTEAFGYGIMYLILVGITLRYTFVYIKRALYLAFFTMIAPLVAITYPIDKVGDSKAQAFDTWIKEYFINAILQPLHLVLYSALEGAGMMLVVVNPIYGIVVLLFIPTAEKWIKSMFKMNAPMTATSLSDVALLGSMFNMGKNIVGGIGKTVGLGALTVATGGAGGAAALAAKAGSGLAGAAGSGLAGAVGGGLAGAVGNGLGGAAGETGAGVAETVLPGGTLEETVNGSQDIPNGAQKINIKVNVNGGSQLDGSRGSLGSGQQGSRPERMQLPAVDLNNLQYYNDMKEAGYSKKELSQLADDLDLTDYLKQKEAQEINSHMIDTNTLGETVPTPEALGGENIDDISGVQSPNLDEINGMQNPNLGDISGTQNQNINTVEPQTEEEKSENDQDKYYSDYKKDKIIKKITEEDPKEEFEKMIIKGATGVAGAVPGAILGAIGAGLTGDSKMIGGGAAAGASVAQGALDTVRTLGSTTFNNNVKVIVKDGNITDKGIVESTARIASQQRWSEGKTVKVAQLAEQFPDLANNTEAQKQIREIMRQQGVSDKKLEEVIKDVMKVQSGVKDIKDPVLEKAEKDLRNWK